VGDAPVLRGLLGLVSASSGRATEVAGVRFPNRVGLAAGMDKDGLAARAWAALGFGFAEVGTVTAQAQPGNERPRVFRLRESGALINRMGFNNHGAEALARTLAEAGIARGSLAAGIPLGVSIGKTKLVAVEDAISDYLTSLDAIAPHADYVAVNVSSPNTPNLRTLQDGGALAELTTALVARAAELAGTVGTLPGVPAGQQPVPIFVKIAPDLGWEQIDEVLTACESAGIAGVIATNTTVGRAGLAASDSGLAQEAGGLSGQPLTGRALEVVRYVVEHTGLPVIGVGGIMTAADATRMFDAGAALIQLYTGFIYHGPGLIAAINATDTRRYPR
ncbi:MAG: quinone-dependent dihydroorotate dehydrogenase, partial [Propionibacteriaceae bacterium]|nr:quinone-dependent dihydroorotate dehydrogenase [Propionibacteriaceae bacterium]